MTQQVLGEGVAAKRPLAMPWERRGRAALEGAWWARALRLDERCAAGVPAVDLAEGTDARRLADLRMARWRAAFADLAADTVDRQAAAYGCTPVDLWRLLGEPPEDLARRVPRPGWARDVERVAASAGDGRGEGEGPEPAWGTGWQRDFARILDPFVCEAVRLFHAAVGADIGTEAATGTDIATAATTGTRDRAAEEARRADLPAVVASVRREAARQSVQLAMRVLVMELNVLRVTGRLEGDTPEARFASFVRHFRRPEGLAELLDEYAVLARSLVAAAERVAQVHAEFLRRLAADRPSLAAELFGGTDPGPLAALDLGRGDTHAGGRSAGIATFASGARVAYKPRPAALHRHVAEVVERCNAVLPAGTELRVPAVVDRGDHGWSEFITAAPCPDAPAAARYFRRQGALLAVLHVLGGVDFHFENLIAAGDRPVPIDLETLLCADLPRPSGSGVHDTDPAAHAYRESVGRVGLLPAVIVGADGQAFDAGGMGGGADAALPYRIAGWAGAGTDTMRLERVTPVLRDAANRPRLDGVELDAVRYAADLLAGYRGCYEALAPSAAGLLAPERFAADPVRVIPRPTHEYSVLLAETTHPDVLREALDREQVYAVLWARGAADPLRARLTRFEVADLWAGDVPLFTTLAGEREVRAADGTPVGELLPESGVDLVRRTLGALGGRHLAEQEWIIAAQLATRADTGAGPEGRAAERAGVPASPVPAPGGPADLAERALAQADAIADRLSATAYRDGPRVGWLGLDLAEDTRWSVRPLGMDLYNGYGGVALFLAQLAAVTGEERRAAQALAALAPVAGRARELLADPDGQDPEGLPGAFTGAGGLAYVLAACGKLLGGTAAADAAALAGPLLEMIRRGLGPEAGHDVISGIAGCLAVAEALAGEADEGAAGEQAGERAGAPGGKAAARAGGLGRAARALAERCVEVLLAGAVPEDGHLSWPGPDGRALLGFSHGASGIGWALLRHARRSGDQEAAAAARRAFAFERAGFDPRTGNWPDRRYDPPGNLFAWCHGAPGVGLARAAAADPGDEDARADLRRALAGTAAFRRQGNDSLCHGESGNLELFAAARDLGWERGRLEWRERAAALVARIERNGPVCGTPGGIATPGLMTGLSGVGHGLLRVAAPDRVPPVLLLPPV
ncbi:type 2 lanthipeptide synthetase LanM family protein [Actinacidiphila reveromycinica]|uniref:type 2 lanthipeptide synthetase LanM family protein n=1 Tax=Actinacidiphila reveromycinica TaxID=659352 RepID=UPI001924C60B|nr:type 2 lanthipeptide synthetase LanM family protein [Streptomyces sp. SN-593]